MTADILNILDALPSRRGHFLLESGYHSDLWLALDALFVDPAAIEPLVVALAERLRPHGAPAVCGPLIGGAFLAQRIATTLGTRFYYTEPLADRDDALFATSYRLPPGTTQSLRGEAVIVVDDVMSAGSSMRATVDALTEAGAVVAAIGAFMVLGDEGFCHFAERNVPVETLRRQRFEMWKPNECPMCQSGTALEDTSTRRPRDQS